MKRLTKAILSVVLTAALTLGAVPACGIVSKAWAQTQSVFAAKNVAESFSPGVTYLDEDGNELSKGDVIELPSNSEVGDGWFVVTGTKTLSEKLTINGNAHLILCDNAELSAPKGLIVATGSSLTIYAQSRTQATMGKLNATGDHCPGIGVPGTLVINGGNITATGTACGANDAYASSGIGGWGEDGSFGTITINDGIIQATASGTDSAFGIGLGDVSGDPRNGDVVINGGRVTAGSCGIGASTILLGWKHSDDSLHANGDDSYSGRVGLADEKFFRVQGTDCLVSADNIYDNSGQILIPAYKVSFDGNGASSGYMDDLGVKPNALYALPRCAFEAPAGMVFDHWKIGSDSYAPGAKVSITENTTIKAIWGSPSAKVSPAPDFYLPPYEPEKPADSVTPEDSVKPEDSEKPEGSEKPEDSEKPSYTAEELDVTKDPSEGKTPEGEAETSTVTEKDGSVTVIFREENTDGSITERVKVTSPNGTVSEKTTVTEKDGTVKTREVTEKTNGTRTETVTVVDPGGDYESKTVTTDKNGKTKVVVETKTTDGSGVVTETKDTVKTSGASTEETKITRPNGDYESEIIKKNAGGEVTATVTETRTTDEKTGKVTLETGTEKQNGATQESKVMTDADGKVTRATVTETTSGGKTVTIDLKTDKKGNVVVRNIDSDKSTVTIPSEVTDADGKAHKVTAITAGALSGESKVKTLVVSKNVEVFEKNALWDSGVTTLKLDSVPKFEKNSLDTGGKLTIIVHTKAQAKAVQRQLKKAGAPDAHIKIVK